MAEWLYEAGIGENRAVMLEDGAIVEARIELPGRLRAGSARRGRLSSILVPGRRGIVELPEGEALMEPLPRELTEGASLMVEIVREALAEAGRDKLARCRPAPQAAEERDGPSLFERLPNAAQHGSSGPDRFEEAGWSEVLEEAGTGDIAFEGGALRMSLTPAMTLFDVDGALPPPALAVAGAAAAARAIRKFDVGGSIGIDLPTLPAKSDRQAAAAAVDELLPQPFERTSVNGFGFLQIVRRRERTSLPELVQGDRTGAAARALLRRAKCAPGAGARTLVAAPAVVARLERWTDELARRIGAPVALRAEPGLAISAGYVHSEHP